MSLWVAGSCSATEILKGSEWTKVAGFDARVRPFPSASFTVLPLPFASKFRLKRSRDGTERARARPRARSRSTAIPLSCLFVIRSSLLLLRSMSPAPTNFARVRARAGPPSPPCRLMRLTRTALRHAVPSRSLWCSSVLQERGSPLWSRSSSLSSLANSASRSRVCPPPPLRSRAQVELSASNVPHRASPLAGSGPTLSSRMDADPTPKLCTCRHDQVAARRRVGWRRVPLHDASVVRGLDRAGCLH